MDEKWSFVGKKEEHCDVLQDPADATCGDNWDHVAYDPEHRLVLSIVPGKRTAQKVDELVADVKRRLAGRVPRLVTTDAYGPYKQAILDAWGQDVTGPRTGKPGRPKGPIRVPAAGLNYATVHKTRQKGRVVSVATAVIFGTVAAVMAALAASSASTHVNTSFLERQNGTDRNRNARKARKTYCFSKDWAVHEAVGYFTLYSYNFCWPVRTLATKRDDGSKSPRTPAMAAGLADHVWTLAEWLSLPAVRHSA
jgi:IS1 family transposase